MHSLHKLSQSLAHRLENFLCVMEGRYDDTWAEDLGMRGIPSDPLSTKAFNTAKHARAANARLLTATDTLLETLKA